MPMPIGHTLSGIALLYAGAPSWRQSRWIVAAVIFFSLLPDFDLLVGLVVAGDANAYHHQASHSLLFVIAAGLLGGAVAARRGRYTGLFIAAGVIHLVLDILAVDTSAPYGAPLLWPFWNGYFQSPLQIFTDVHRSGVRGEFFASLINRHNFEALLIEIAVMMPFFLVIYLSRHAKMNTRKGSA
jgi:hypothetical protein